MKYIYLIIIKLYTASIFLVSPFNNKAKQWIKGRKNWKNKLKKNNAKENWIWFHVASLGEFEQARPLIEKIKQQKPYFKILLTFFSPSGYEIRKNYSYADNVMYLPADSPKNASFFLDRINPKIVFFVKYDLWYFYLNEIKKRKIKAYLISAIFRENQLFFKKYGRWYANVLKAFDKIFVQDENSKNLLQKIGIQNVIITGDTRFDRVIAIAENSSDIPVIKNFCQNNFCIVAGSTWEPDEKLIARFLSETKDNIKFIIAPHNIDNQHINKLEQLLSVSYIKYSNIKNEIPQNIRAVIIDNIGMLASLYKYAQIAYIGGGFGEGIHNILEAAVYGIVVIFGPKYHKFKEAIDLIQLQAAFSIKNFYEFKEKLYYFVKNRTQLVKLGTIAKKYIYKNKNATEKIFKQIDF